LVVSTVQVSGAAAPVSTARAAVAVLLLACLASLPRRPYFQAGSADLNH
jgi:hypothetical protein